MDKQISQNLLLTGNALDREREYWLGKLDGDLVVSGFFRNAPVTASQRINNIQAERGTHSFIFPADVHEKLRTIAKGSGFGMFILLLTGVFYLLAKYSGNRDIIAGAPVAVQKKPGNYLNHALALRCRVEDHMSFKELLKQARQTVSEAYNHMNFPLTKLVELLGLPSGYSENGHGLFDTLVVLKNIHSSRDTNTGVHNNVSIYGTVFTFDSGGSGLTGAADYRISSCTKDEIRRLSQHIVNFFRHVTEYPGSLLGEIDVLSPGEKEELLHLINGKTLEYPSLKTVHRLVEDQVKKSPDAPALSDTSKSLTYRQLNEAANRLAHRLNRDHGIRMGDIAACCFPRTIEAIIAVLGILKAGAVCFPIDLNYPLNRIHKIIEDSGAKALLTLPDADMPTGLAKKAVEIDFGALSTDDLPNIEGTGDAMSPAYLIYSSGSTGRPKGILLRHRGITSQIFGIAHRLDLGQDDVFCHNQSFSYVVSIWHIFGPLVLGSRFILYPQEVMGDSYRLMQQSCTDGITILEVVPSLLNSYLQLLEEGKDELPLTTLRALILTGEQTTPALVERYYRRYDIPLVNAYGQSENSDDTLFYNIPRTGGTAPVLIGTPIVNSQVVVLDTFGQLQPTGLAGELAVAGDGLAIGYLNHPELTAEKFLRFTAHTSHLTRLYKTGDMAKWMPCGNIRYLGRADRQVKVRGVRVEINEIEICLQKHEAVKDAAVITRNSENGNILLDAYIVPATGKELDVSALREFLGEELPSVMIPAHFIQVGKMPLTTSGKINRQVLATENNSHLKLKTIFMAPKTRIERIIAEAWQEVLKLDSVGSNDNFFDIGGHSFDFMVVGARLETQLKRNIPVIDMLKYPTIATLAGYLSSSGQEEDISPKEQALSSQLGLGKNRLKQRNRRALQGGIT